MGGAYPYMDLISQCQIWKTFTTILRQSIQIRISPKRGKCTWNSNVQTKCRTERKFHAFKFSDGYKSTMNWCSVYLTPQGLPKYIYLSPPLIFPTTYNGIGTKNRPVWITPGAAPIRWMGPIRNPRWEQKRTEGYIIVSRKDHAEIKTIMIKTPGNMCLRCQMHNPVSGEKVHGS